MCPRFQGAITREPYDSRTLFYTCGKIVCNLKFTPTSRVAVASRSVRV